MADLKIASHALLTFSVAVATSSTGNITDWQQYPLATSSPHCALALTELQVRNFEYVTNMSKDKSQQNQREYLLPTS